MDIYELNENFNNNSESNISVDQVINRHRSSLTAAASIVLAVSTLSSTAGCCCCCCRAVLGRFRRANVI